MKRSKVFKIIVIIGLAGIVIGGGIGLYLFNQPHRDVQTQNADYSLTGSQIVDEYLSNSNMANEKYLADDGESKILEITGIVSNISENYNGQKVVLLLGKNDKAGVSASFTEETNANAENIKIGEIVTIKGVIRSGASYDEDLELYEHVVLEKCDLIK